MKPFSRATRTTWALVLIALLWRGLFLPVSNGAYTDGILQIDSFRVGLTYWPPLYAIMARVFAWIPGVGLELSARLVSWLAGALALAPLAAIGARLFGMRAAFWAMIAWIASPMATRWSLQVMTDMPTMALWTGSLAALTIGVEHWVPGAFPVGAGAGTAARPRQGLGWMLIASLLGALATLTRYQGVLLLPPMALAAALLTRAAGRAEPQLPLARLKLWLTLTPWLAPPLWILRGGIESLTKHFQQIHDRGAALPFSSTLLRVYWFQFEDFFMRAPYFFAYGIFLFMLYGLARVQWATARLRWAGWLTLYLALTVVAAQAVFSSFQERYLLPLLPCVCLFAGHGVATCERLFERRRGRFALLVVPSLGSALIFSLCVATRQGAPFLDVKEASRAMTQHYSDLEKRRIFSNERFNESISGAKVSFWTGGRNVLFLPEAAQQEAGTFREGDLIVLISAYGGVDFYRRERDALIARGATMLARFPRSALPLFPDIMAEPGTSQNPLALDYRYAPQYFETSLLEMHVALPPLLRDSLPTPAAAATPDPRDAERLRSLQNQLNELQGRTGRWQ